MLTKTIRVVSREVDGSLRTKDHDSVDAIKVTYDQIGVDDCSTDLTLRGFPVFRGFLLFCFAVFGPQKQGGKNAPNTPKSQNLPRFLF